MTKKGTYEDYLDYFDLDMDSFMDFDEYLDSLLQNEPVNYDQWTADQKESLKQSAKTNYRKNLTDKGKKVQEIKSTFEGSGKTFSENRRNQFDKILDKKESNTKLTKTENKLFSKMVFTRAAEIRKGSNLNKKVSTALAWSEFN